jgi:hypothetical protein
MGDRDGEGRILYFRLEPVREPPDDGAFRIAGCANVTCMATGEVLDGEDGPAAALSPGIVEALDARGTGAGPRTVVDAAALHALTLALARTSLALRAAGGDPALLADAEAALGRFPPDP